MTEDEPRAGMTDRGRITHYTTEEGDAWWPLAPGCNTSFGIFAIKFENGDIWDPIVGWRRTKEK